MGESTMWTMCAWWWPNYSNCFLGVAFSSPKMLTMTRVVTVSCPPPNNNNNDNAYGIFDSTRICQSPRLMDLICKR